MGTRSCVAIPEGDSWRGRYVHSDGYPTGVGAMLQALVMRHGLEDVQHTIVLDNYGWSGLNPDQKDELSDWNDDGRFKAIPGYGVAYTTEQDQSRPDDWITPDNVSDWWVEWAYVLGVGGLLVMRVPYSKSPVSLGIFPWNSEIPFADLEA